MKQPPAHVDITVIAPSRNEAPNVRLLVKRLDEQLTPAGLRWEILFADDSDDDTPQAIRRLGDDGFPVRMNHRHPAERVGGQPGALVEAFAIARGEVVVVLDADLKHPPELVLELVAPLLAGTADLAIGSRYRGGASATSLDGAFHHLVSRTAAWVYRSLFREVRRVTDPGSGFYAFRREVIDRAVLKPENFRVLVEVLVRGRWSRHVEVPVSYAGRMLGARKLTSQQVWRFTTHMLRLWVETRIDPQRHAETPAARDRCRDAAERLEALEPVGDPATPPMRVLVIASEAPPTRSGVAHAIGRIADGLRGRGHDVTVLTSADAWRRVRGELRVSGLGLRVLLRPRMLDGYDVVNLHGPAPTLSEVVLLTLRLRPRAARPRLVYTHHFDMELRGLGLPTLVYNVVHGRLCRSADELITTTPSYAAIVGAGRVANAPHVVPWAVDPPAVEPEREPYQGDRPLRVLFVGQQRDYKGIGVLIQAIAHSPKLELTAVGSGPLLDAHRDLVRRLGARNVTVTGHLDEHERDALFATHDVIALPSVTRLEAFGIVLLEGMRVGCVPVASDLAGVRDVVGPAGVLVPPRRAARLRELLEELADDPGRVAELSSLAVDRASALTWDRCIRQYEHVLAVEQHD